ncbi:MAG: CBS domain-containing protein [Oligoflexia bacterium]|nr:CBS domain-containing protein [Oligoflexia bacterium]
MFYIRELTGLIAPYSPGAVRQRRAVNSVNALTPVSERGDTSSATEFAHQMSAELEHGTTVAGAAPIITAYERAMNPESPRRRVLMASEMMTKGVVTIAPSASLKEAHMLFAEKRFRHVPVVNESAALVGVLSDRDLLRRAAQIGVQPHPVQKPWEAELVSAVMSAAVLVASEDTEMREVARVMFRERIGCMPILDEAQQLVGIITRSDVLRTLLVQAPLELWR